MNRDHNFFMSKSVSDKYIKNDERKEWMEGMVLFIRSRYKDLSDDELDRIWKCINNMLQCVIKYKILKNEFKQ